MNHKKAAGNQHGVLLAQHSWVGVRGRERFRKRNANETTHSTESVIGAEGKKKKKSDRTSL